MNTPSIVLAGRTVTRAHVLAAVAELETMGRVPFLRRYGYREASRFVLRVNGRSYPSKAVLGVAAGLTPDQFFGGARGAAGLLVRLGFVVRNAETGAAVSRELDSLRRACEREGLAVGEDAWPAMAVEPSAYFASGSNRPGEIRGLSRAGADVGVAAPEVSPAAEAELVKLAGSDVLVFVDSGAFSEVEFGAAGPVVVRPITDGDWQRILGLYGRLAAALREQLFVVAPDRVGDQGETLARLGRYAPQLRAIAAEGARVLVPMQKGAMSQAAFAAAVDAILPGVAWVPALPAKKAATTAAEVAAFVEARRPAHVHLLGLGIRSRQLAAYLAPFADGRTSVSLDSCWLAANVGTTNGRGGGARRLTRARDVAARVLSRMGALARFAVTELAAYCCLAGAGLKA